MPFRFRRALRAIVAFLLFLFSASALAQATPAQNLVGFWWKPSESGWGLTIQQQGTSTFAVWFTYDAQGAAVWYTLTCTFAGTTCAGDLYTGNGTPLWQITGPANLVAIKVGTGAIITTAANRLSLTYTVGGTTQTKAGLEPQDFAVAAQVPSCSLQPLAGLNPRAGLTNYTDHWWGGHAASGWGLQISHQGHRVFAGWYSYNLQGTATWLTAIGTQGTVNPRRFTGTLYVVNPGIPFSTIQGPVAETSVRASGSFDLTFSDGERGTFTWSLPAPGSGPSPGPQLVVRTLAIERFAIAGGALNACTTGKPGAVSGRVVASHDPAMTVGGARIVDLLTNATLAVADPAGRFEIPAQRDGTPLRVSISADGYLTRETGLQPGTQDVVADIIRLAPPFSLAYYRQLVRPASNGSDAKPGFALAGWRADTINVYLRTNQVDPTDRTRPPVDTGIAVPEAALASVLVGLERTIADIAGGAVRVGLIERGAGAAREAEPGWMAVDFFDAVRHPQPDYIGIAGTGANGSASVRLGYPFTPIPNAPPQPPTTACAYLHPGLAMHELGHVFGLFHAEIDAPNVMQRAGGNASCADVRFSPAERFHGRIAFTRPRGNEDPDRDPAGFVLPGIPR